MRKLDERKEENETRRKILKWLSPDDFEETYERHFKKRHNNTGKWLLDDHSFKDWRDGKKSSLLWCHGARKLQLYINLYRHFINVCGVYSRFRKNNISV